MLDSVDLDQGEQPANTTANTTADITADLAADMAADRGQAPDVAPVTPSTPVISCGPDLDAEGDADYLNFFARIEGILPTSFFSPEDGKPFDPSTIDMDVHRAALRPLQTRTCDVRLATVEAQLAALNRDITGFTAAVETIALWLDGAWDDVHPRPQDGNTESRQRAIGALDLPTVIFPLQYAPLLEARRIGTVTFRRWLVTTGEAKAREGDTELSAAAITQALDEADESELAAMRDHIGRLDTALGRIRAAFAAHGSSADLPNLSALIGKMRAFLGQGAAAQTAPAEHQEDGAAAPGEQQDAARGAAGPAPASLADATLALAAIADYYSRREPSSPVLPLVRQARELVGKSFHEIVTILVPSQVEKAAFQIGTDQVFDLPLGKLSNHSAVMPDAAQPSEFDQSGAPDAPARPRYRVETRGQAIALLQDVQRYFRIHEPSSPVPMLCERGRAMAERDFMSLLRDVLPKAALRNVNADK